MPLTLQRCVWAFDRSRQFYIDTIIFWFPFHDLLCCSHVWCKRTQEFEYQRLLGVKVFTFYDPCCCNSFQLHLILSFFSEVETPKLNHSITIYGMWIILSTEDKGNYLLIYVNRPTKGVSSFYLPLILMDCLAL